MHKAKAVNAISNCIALMITAGYNPVASGDAYTVIDLGPPGTTLSEAWDLNDAGEIVGFASINGVDRAIKWRRDSGSGAITQTDLGSLTVNGSATAFAINEVGKIVGQSVAPSPHAFLFDEAIGTPMRDIGGFPSFFPVGFADPSFRWARGINLNGTIVGAAQDVSPTRICQFCAVKFNGDGTVTNLHPTGLSTSVGNPQFSEARAVNKGGQIIGTWGGLAHEFAPNAGLLDGYFLNSHAVVWDASGVMTDLQTLYGGPFDFSLAISINDTGQIVGETSRLLTTATEAATTEAFIYENGAMSSIGTLGGAFSRAEDINNNGSIVGSSYTPAHVPHAFLHSNGQMLDLNELTDSDWELLEAHATSDNGNIVGKGLNKKTLVRHALLLIPNRPVAVAKAKEVTTGNEVVAPVREGVALMLDGSSSNAPACTRINPPKPCPSYSWSQIGGPTVSLTGSNTASPTFTTPTLSAAETSQVLSFKLTVSDGLFSADDIVEVTDVYQNKPPVAAADSPLVVKEDSAVDLDGSGSYDPEGGVLTYAWSNTSAGPPCSDIVLAGETTARPTFTAPLVESADATCTFALSVTDGEGLSSDAPAGVVVTVENVNHPPVADAGSNATANIGDTVTLNGSGSYDPDRDPLSYAWIQVSGPAVTLNGADSVTPSFAAPAVSANATLVFELAVNDGAATDTAQVSLLVLAPSAPPACGNAKASPAWIEKPDHRLQPIEIEELGEDKREWITGDAEDGQDNVTLKIVKVRQDEPTAGLGSGDTSPDAAILVKKRERDKVMLRAERREGGNGRVYTVTFQATDKAGHTCQGAVKVCVPATNRQKVCNDDGATYDSLTR